MSKKYAKQINTEIFSSIQQERLNNPGYADGFQTNFDMLVRFIFLRHFRPNHEKPATHYPFFVLFLYFQSVETVHYFDQLNLIW